MGFRTSEITLAIRPVTYAGPCINHAQIRVEDFPLISREFAVQGSHAAGYVSLPNSAMADFGS